jgi:hypothetical protein
VAVAVFVAVGVAVRVGVWVGVFVAVGVAVGVRVAVWVAVAVAVGVGVCVGVLVGVVVGVFVGVGAVTCSEPFGHETVNCAVGLLAEGGGEETQTSGYVSGAAEAFTRKLHDTMTPLVPSVAPTVFGA